MSQDWYEGVIQELVNDLESAGLIANNFIVRGRVESIINVAVAKVTPTYSDITSCCCEWGQCDCKCHVYPGDIKRALLADLLPRMGREPYEQQMLAEYRRQESEQ